MGAYTSAYCYRAGGTPPTITTHNLADFVERILALDILDSKTIGIKLKFGQAIDQDDDPIYREVEVREGLFMYESDLDIDEIRLSYPQAIDLLHSNFAEFGGNTVYRASLDLGSLRDEIWEQFSHGDGEYYTLLLSGLSFGLGPAILQKPEEPVLYQLGYMEFSVHGGGYLSHRTYEETLTRLRNSLELAAIRDFCRTMWPATSEFPSRRDITIRKKMGRLWAEPLNAPFDWYWAINETY